MSEIILIFSTAAVPIVGIAVFIFILAQTAFNAVYSGLKQRTAIFKALAALVIWFAVSCAMFYIVIESQIEPLEFRGLNPGFFEKYSPYLLFAGLVIYVLIGVGLGFWIKGRTKWRTPNALQKFI